LKLDLSILTTLVYSAELLTLSYSDALDRLRVRLNIIFYKQNDFVYEESCSLFVRDNYYTNHTDKIRKACCIESSGNCRHLRF